MTADITVWANDRCSKSRGAEAILQERGVDYLRVIKAMYFDAPVADMPAPRENRPLRIAFALNALALLVLGIFWNPVMAWCQQAFGA